MLRIPSGFRSFVYCTAIREGGEKEWNFASYRYSKETDATERNNLLNGMSCTRLTWLISRFLNDLIDKDKVRIQDTLTGLRAAAIRPDSILKTWNFVKENWNELFSRYKYLYNLKNFCLNCFILGMELMSLVY